jgi:hypothetical protein
MYIHMYSDICNTYVHIHQVATFTSIVHTEWGIGNFFTSNTQKRQRNVDPPSLAGLEKMSAR